MIDFFSALDLIVEIMTLIGVVIQIIDFVGERRRRRKIKKVGSHRP